jgi:hypothetical protein
MISGEFFLTATAVATCIRRCGGGEGADVWPPPQTSNATTSLTTMIDDSDYPPELGRTSPPERFVIRLPCYVAPLSWSVI